MNQSRDRKWVRRNFLLVPVTVIGQFRINNCFKMTLPNWFSTHSSASTLRIRFNRGKSSVYRLKELVGTFSVEISILWKDSRTEAAHEIEASLLLISSVFVAAHLHAVLVKNMQLQARND